MLKAVNQNFWLKISLTTALAIGCSVSYYMAFITFVAFGLWLIKLKLFVFYVKVITKILPLFIVLLASSFLINIDFYKQLMLVGKIVVMVLLSVFLLKTTNKKYLINDCHNKSKILNNCLIFILALQMFMKDLKQGFLNGFSKKNIENTLKTAFGNVRNYEQKIAKNLQQNKGKRRFLFLPNIFMVFVTIIIFTGSVLCKNLL